ncbi:MAG: hypothetical protein GF353_19080 [Candidatus Lokiarchaeota archaeon]|nr:hypothetical protein [Candidatus Lokiarchaeota archaeon]
MKELIFQITAALIPAILIALLTSYLTVRLSIKQFYSQKWWEKKAEMYSKIIEYLSYLEVEYNNVLGLYLDIDDNFRNDNDFKAKCHESYKFLQLLVAQGTFIVTNETVKVLKENLKLIDKFENHLDEVKCVSGSDGNAIKMLKDIIENIKDGIDEIRGQAKHDLNVK